MAFSVRLPFWSDGLDISVTQEAGDGSHSGQLYYSWDFALGFGHRVRAIADGVVVDIRESVPDGEAVQTTPHSSMGSGNIGNIVTLRHSDGGSTYYSSYFHLRQNSVPVSIGETILKGEEIGQVGNTGFRYGTHLHLQVGISTLAFGNTDTYGWPAGTDNHEPQTIADASNISPNLDLVSFEGYGVHLPSSVVGPPPDSSSLSEPDLIADSVSVSATQISASDTIDVSWEVANIGSGDMADSAYAGVYLSTNSTISASDILLHEETFSRLDAGERDTNESQSGIALPSGLAPGTYWIGVLADNRFSVSESNENNNGSSAIQITVSGAVGGGSSPDLIADSVSVSATQISASDTIDVSWEVANIGSGDMADSAYAGVYLSTDSTISASDILLHEETFSRLDAGERDTNESQSGIALPSGLAPGTYWIGVLADNRFSVSESNENNNAALPAMIEIFSGTGGPGPADLLARNLVLGSTNWSAGDAISASWEIVNEGDADADSSQSSVYLSTESNVTTADRRIISDSSTGVMSVGEVNPEGNGSNGSDPYVVPGDLSPGTYYVAVFADDLDTVFEADESNNRSNVVQITVDAPVQNPDLIVQSPSIDTSAPEAGATTIFRFDVRNVGAGSSPVSTSAVYISTDSTITTGDTRLGAQSTNALGPNAVDVETQSITIPGTLAPGTYWVGAIADYNDTIFEANDANNTSPGVQITVSAPVQSLFTNRDDVVTLPQTGTYRALGGNDTVTGTSSSDTIYGQNGSDLLRGRGGSDMLIGGALDDVLVGGAGADNLNGGDGTDTASYAYAPTGIIFDGVVSANSTGQAAGDVLIDIEIIEGTGFNDILRGTAQTDTFFGAGGNDTLAGRGSVDVLEGGDGNDVLLGGAGGDILTGGAGRDFLRGDAGIDRALYVDASAGVTVDLVNFAANTGEAFGDKLFLIENIDGSDHGDSLRGDAEANVMRGRDGDDALRGRGGDDTLDGGRGDDELLGGGGGDTFFFASRNGGVDTILDFEPGVDRLAFSSAAFGNLALGALRPIHFDDVGNIGAHDRFIYDTATGELHYDANGGVAGERYLVAILTGAPALSASDIEIV